MGTVLLFLVGIAIALAQNWLSWFLVKAFFRDDGLSKQRMHYLAGALAYSWYLAEVAGALLVRVHAW